MPNVGNRGLARSSEHDHESHSCRSDGQPSDTTNILEHNLEYLRICKCTLVLAIAWKGSHCRPGPAAATAGANSIRNLKETLQS